MNKLYSKHEAVVEWIKGLSDDDKKRFVMNWRLPHSLMNMASSLYPGDKKDLQQVDWYRLFKTRDIGTWSHGGPIKLPRGYHPDRSEETPTPALTKWKRYSPPGQWNKFVKPRTIMLNACPRCGAPKEYYCATTGGNVMYTPHKERYQA